MVTVGTQTDWVDPAAESWATAKLSIFLPVEGWPWISCLMDFDGQKVAGQVILSLSQKCCL